MCCIDDIGTNERKARIGGDRLQRIEVAGIGQLIDDDERNEGVWPMISRTNASREAGSAGHETDWEYLASQSDLGGRGADRSADGNISVSFDPDAMQELDVSLHDPISIDVPKTTVGKALEAIAAELKMAVIVENGQIVLTSTAEHREDLRPISYSVKDLTGSHVEAAADLAALLQRLVAPESWRPNGGRGTVEIAPEALKITQTGHVHYQVLVFCEKLRVARGLPTKSQLARSDPQRFALATRTERAKEVLERVTSIDVSVPAPLGSILDRLKPPAGPEIFIDRPALAAGEVSESKPVKFRADKLPLGEALGKLLDPLELTWRAVDADTLQVTTCKAAAARMELEFYPVGRLLAGQPAAAWIERITKLPGAKWAEGGGGGAVYFDPTCQCLIVLQSPPVQRAIAALLKEKAK